jgi:hypothetical protein
MQYNNFFRMTMERSFLSKSTCFVLCTLYLFLSSCNSTYTSKKSAYFKIDFPERKYIAFQQEGFPYTFEYPVYAQVVKDSTYFDSNPENPYWINIDFPQFGGRIFLSYKDYWRQSIVQIKTGQRHI